jgi:hypothetical protein
VRDALLALLLLTLPALAQEGNLGHGHDEWHEGFYNGLVTPVTKVSCCSLSDCRPTSGRAVGDHYEVKVNGSWIRVLASKVLKVTAPDWGFHVCAPKIFDGNPEHVYCVVLPPEN